jgi:hypothetical protein
MNSAAATPLAGRIRRAAATVAWGLLVVAGAVTALRIADVLPGLALGAPRGVRRFATVMDLERASGRRMPVPAYYPNSVEWPPSEQRTYPDGSASIWCRQRSQGAPWLIIATAPAGASVVAPQVLPRSAELQRGEGSLGGHPAVLTRVQDADGAVWQQIQWRSPREIVLVRYRGTLEELMTIAGSMYE